MGDDYIVYELSEAGEAANDIAKEALVVEVEVRNVYGKEMIYPANFTAGKMKRRKDHLVPLSKQALAILREMKLRTRGSIYVFPSDRRDDRPMSENSILYLIHRIGYKGRMTGHGFRSVGSTWANELGYTPDAIERQLAHVPENKVRSIYNRAAYLPERQAMLQAWADWFDSCADVDAGRAKS